MQDNEPDEVRTPSRAPRIRGMTNLGAAAGQWAGAGATYSLVLWPSIDVEVSRYSCTFSARPRGER